MNAIYAIAWRSLKKIQDFNGVWTRDLAITGAILYQLSYEATDVGSRSIVGSYVPVKEMSVNDVWNKSYMNCGNEMKMKKWSSQWSQFVQLQLPIVGSCWPTMLRLFCAGLNAPKISGNPPLTWLAILSMKWIKFFLRLNTKAINNFNSSLSPFSAFGFLPWVNNEEFINSWKRQSSFLLFNFKKLGN